GRVHRRQCADARAFREVALLVSAPSASRGGGSPSLPISLVGPGTTAVDLSYGEAAIPFLAWARAANAHEAIDGLGMLVEQAVESFRLWHGARPDTEAVFTELQGRAVSLVSAD